MLLADLARTALHSLWQQKARTFLTLTGVLVGTCSLAFSLSLGVGLRAMIDREFKKRDEFWWIRTYTGQRGTVIESDDEIPREAIAIDPAITGERAARLRQALIDDYRRSHPPKTLQLITPAIMEKLRAIPDVDEIRTSLYGNGPIDFADKPGQGLVHAARLDQYDPPLESRLIQGRVPQAPGECVVSEYLLFRMGFRTNESLASLLGRPLTMSMGEVDSQKGFSLAALMGPKNPKESITLSQASIFERLVRQLPEKLDSFDLSADEKSSIRKAMGRKSDALAAPPRKARGTYTVVGILRLMTKDELATKLLSSKIRDGNFTDLYISAEDGEQLFGQLAETKNRGYSDVQVHCRTDGDLRATVEAIKALNLETASTLEWYESSKLEVTLISVGLNVFSIVALFIAAIGITNTLVTSVLERTREIGIFKSLGATDRVVTWLFLSEGALIGVGGGMLGVLIARIIARPADDLVKHLVQKVSRNKLISDSVFEFPAWLVGGALLFAVTLTTVAAWYPARRASRIEPVEALRHE